MDEFLDHFKKRSRVEHSWLHDIYQSVRDASYPVGGASVGLSAEQLVMSLVSKLQQACGTSTQTLPVSYRLVSVSELLSRQRAPCCSILNWSTAQYRDWAREAERARPSHRALPRANLLLIGCLSDGRALGAAQDMEQRDGFWRVQDVTGNVRCEIRCPSPDWMGQLMLFPIWNFIPQIEPEHEKGTGGYLELTASPVPLTPDPPPIDLCLSPSEVVGVKQAARLLRSRSSGMQLCVEGEVCVVCPMLQIAGKSFFCFRLQEGGHAVPVLVTNPVCLFWRQCLSVGQNVCVSGLQVCSLKGWAGRRLLSVTAKSRLHLSTVPKDTSSSDATDTQVETEADEREETDKSDAESQGQAPSRHTQLQTKCTQSQTNTHSQSLEAETLDHVLQAEACPSHHTTLIKRKQSKMISYKGTVTKVLDAEAGLYEIDEKVGLCVAYQPIQKWGGGLRIGAEIELHNVHFVYRPCPFAPPTMLCACLRSTVTVTAFSRLGSKVSAALKPDAPMLRLLMEKNLGVSEYLWLWHCQAALTERLCPRWVSVTRVSTVAQRLLEYVLDGEQQKEKEKRDIYREMLQDPHLCPLAEYYAGWPDSELLSIAALRQWMEKECWSSLSLPALLPPAAAHMTGVELNPLLSWSTRSLPLQERGGTAPAVLVGVLELSPTRVTLQLHDQTAAIDCAVTSRAETGAQCAVDNTAWLGCLVCIRHCTLVMERFMKTNFPSAKHLDQEKHITHKHCRVYMQLCVEDLHILSPSAAMLNLQKERRREGCSMGGRGKRGGVQHKGDTEEERPFVQQSDGAHKRRETESEKRTGEGVQRPKRSRGKDGEEDRKVVSQTETKRTKWRKGSRVGDHQEIKDTEQEVKETDQEVKVTDQGVKETDQEVKETDQEVKETDQGVKETDQGVKETDQGVKETDQGVKETDQEVKETDQGVKETDQEVKETDQEVKETDQGIKETHPNATGSSSEGLTAKRPVTSRDPCVSLAFRLEAKEGVAFRNLQTMEGAPGLTLSFVAKVTRLGEVQQWERDPKNSVIEEREQEGEGTMMELQFVGSSVRWFPLLHPGSSYRLVALHTVDVSLLSCSSLPAKGGLTPPSNPSLAVQPRWRIHTVTCPPSAKPSPQPEAQIIMSVSKVRHCSSAPDVVSLHGVISQRITLHEEKGKTPIIQSLTENRGANVEADLKVRLTLQDCEAPDQSVQVYLDLSHTPYMPGLVAGATVLLHDVQRKVSQLNNVYCRSLPISCVTVTALASDDVGPALPRPAPPVVLLGDWVSTRAQQCVVGRVRGHVVCVLHLRLQWVCALCGSIFKQAACTRMFPQCDSTNAVFQAEAKVAVEDGSGEAQVWVSSEIVARLLLLDMAEWEVLQRHIRVRGHLRVYTRGWNMVSDVDHDELLVQYLCCLCSSNIVCRQMTLTCQLRSRKQEKPQLRKFCRGDREFLTKFSSPLQLTCTEITEDTPAV